MIFPKKDFPAEAVGQAGNATAPEPQLQTVLILGFFLSALFVAMPFLSVPVFPFVDYPLHLSLIQIASGRFPADSPIPGQFTTHWFTPYSITYLLSAILPFPVEITGKVLLLFYVFFTPLSFLFLLKSLRMNPAYSLFIFPLLFNFNLSWGFIPFLISIPMLFTAAAAACKAALNEQDRIPFAVSGIVTLIFFTHLFTFILVCILIPVIFLLGRGSLRRKVKSTIVSCFPGGVLSLIWYSTLHFSRADSVFLSKRFIIPGIGLKLRFFPDYVISGDPGLMYRWVFYGLICLAVIIVISVKPHTLKYQDPQTASEIRLRRGIAVTLWSLYFLCPYSLLTAVWLFNRIAWTALAGTILLLPAQTPPKRKYLFLGVVLLTIILSVRMTWLFLEFEKESLPAFQCMSGLEKGRRLRTLILSSRSRWSDQTPYDHFGQYYQLRYNGIVHNPFAVLTHMPIHYTADRMGREAGSRPEVTHDARGYHADVRFSDNDYFLLRRPARLTADPIPQLFGANARKLRLLRAVSDWIVFEKRHLKPGAKAG